MPPAPHRVWGWNSVHVCRAGATNKKADTFLSEWGTLQRACTKVQNKIEECDPTALTFVDEQDHYNPLRAMQEMYENLVSFGVDVSLKGSQFVLSRYALRDGYPALVCCEFSELLFSQSTILHPLLKHQLDVTKVLDVILHKQLESDRILRKRGHCRGRREKSVELRMGCFDVSSCLCRGERQKFSNRNCAIWRETQRQLDADA